MRIYGVFKKNTYVKDGPGLLYGLCIFENKEEAEKLATDLNRLVELNNTTDRFVATQLVLLESRKRTR